MLAKNILFIVIRVNTIHFGIKPKKGGMPPNDKKFINKLTGMKYKE